MTNQSDEEIAILVQKGDTESFGILVERYQDKMVRYAKRFLFNIEDIKDIIQNVFIKAYINIKGFNAKRRFSPWLYRIAHNEFINAIKKKRHEPLPLFNPDIIFPHPISKETADAEVNFKDLKNTLDHCLEKLDPKYREPLILYFFEEIDYRDIADILRIPVSTVGVRLARGKAILKKIYYEINSYGKRK